MQFWRKFHEKTFKSAQKDPVWTCFHEILQVEQIHQDYDQDDNIDVEIPIPKEIERNTRDLLKDINKMDFDVVAEFRVFQQVKNADSLKAYKEFLDVLRNMTEVTDKILQTRVEEDDARAKHLELKKNLSIERPLGLGAPPTE